MTRKPPAPNASEVVTLADLAPRRPVIGGSERRVFGSDLRSAQEHNMATANKSTKDLPAGKSVKGGKVRIPR